MLNAIQTGTNTLSRRGVSGAGFINQKGTGTTILNNTETYTGSTNVSAGTLQIGDGTSGNLMNTSGVVVTGTGTLALNLSAMSTASFSSTVALNAAGASLKAIQSGQVNVSGVISGSGAVDQNGTGTTVLSRSTETAIAGATNVNAGILAVDGSLAAGSTVNVGTFGDLIGTGTINGKVTLTGNGTIDFDNGIIASTLAVTGGNWTGEGTVNGLVTSSSGTFNIGPTSTLTAPAGVAVTGGMLSGSGMLEGSLTYTSSSSSTFAGIIADGTSTISSLTMNKASSTLILTGAKPTYSGATTVSAGTLQVGDGTTTNTSLGTGAITVSGTGILAVDLPDMSTFSLHSVKTERRRRHVEDHSSGHQYTFRNNQRHGWLESKWYRDHGHPRHPEFYRHDHRERRNAASRRHPRRGQQGQCGRHRHASRGWHRLDCRYGECARRGHSQCR